MSENTEKPTTEAVELDRFVRWLLIIMGTVVATLNLTRLLPTNPDYEASWFKFALAVALVAIGSRSSSSNTEMSHE